MPSNGNEISTPTISSTARKNFAMTTRTLRSRLGMRSTHCSINPDTQSEIISARITISASRASSSRLMLERPMEISAPSRTLPISCNMPR